jgi:hypothetical protein
MFWNLSDWILLLWAGRNVDPRCEIRLHSYYRWNPDYHVAGAGGFQTLVRSKQLVDIRTRRCRTADSTKPPLYLLDTFSCDLITNVSTIQFPQLLY